MEFRKTEQTGLTEGEQGGPAASRTGAPSASERGEEKKRWRKPGTAKDRPGKKAGKKKWIAVCVLLALAVGAGLYLRSRASAKASAAEVSYTTAEVTRQDVSQTLSGSGTLAPANSYTVTSLVSGEVLTDTFEEGDAVTEGDVLYTLDSSNAANSQSQAQNSYKQAQRSYTQAVAAKYPSAEIGGIVSETFVHNGDSVQSGTALCTIVANNNLIIDFSFTYTSADEFYVGQSATVYITGFAGTVNGTVTGVSNASSASSNGMKLCTVRVEMANPGLVTTDYTAQAVINGNNSYGSASIHLSSTNTVYAGASGTVENFSVLVGDSVTAGQRLCTITGDSVDNQIENAKISLENAQTSLSNSQSTLDNYTITAPISGQVITKSVKAGDNLSTSGSTQGMAVIYDLSYLKIDMAIDELDISDVTVGQSVTVTADAVDGSFTGTVSKISISGTTSGGVTTYPVTVIIEEYGDLLPGMNVSAEIVVSEASDVLTVPNAAINRGNTVLVTADSPSASNALTDQTAPDGYVYVQVTTGVSDDDNIEVTDGLQEGDTVAYVEASASSDSSEQMTMGMAMGGGMPSDSGMPSGGGGGMPSGGGPQG